MAHLADVLLYALFVSVVSWTVTHEEVFVELRSWAEEKMDAYGEISPWLAKPFYPLMCHFCFSFWVTLATLAYFRFRPFGYVLTHGVLWATSNALMTTYETFRVKIAERRVAMQHNTVAIQQAKSVAEMSQIQLKQARKMIRMQELNEKMTMAEQIVPIELGDEHAPN